MRKLLALAALPAILAASPALAQSGVSGTVTIDGFVDGRCMFTLPNATISLGELSLSSNGRLDASKVDGRSATLKGWCNGTASTMSVQTTPLTNPVTATAGFDNRVDYTGTALANAASASDSSLTAGSDNTVTVGQFNGDVVVSLSLPSSPNNGLMVAGAYTGNVQVTLTPAL